MTFQSTNKTIHGLSAHHAAAKMSLDLLRIEILDFQNVHLAFGSFQDPLAVQHALLKVGRLLEQLILGGNLSQLPLQWRTEQKPVWKQNQSESAHSAWPESLLFHENYQDKRHH